jgi:hypothetical protein
MYEYRYAKIRTTTVVVRTTFSEALVSPRLKIANPMPPRSYVKHVFGMLNVSHE